MFSRGMADLSLSRHCSSRVVFVNAFGCTSVKRFPLNHNSFNCKKFQKPQSGMKTSSLLLRISDVASVVTKSKRSASSAHWTRCIEPTYLTLFQASHIYSCASYCRHPRLWQWCLFGCKRSWTLHPMLHPRQHTSCCMWLHSHPSKAMYLYVTWTGWVT